ncbi:MAG: amidohydrolase [Deltaproteobacteria bacterium]|nr:amidohydrolase [Deltaproteobacteria bacterium]
MTSRKPELIADLLISNGTVLTIDDGNTMIENGAVAVKNDTIVAVAPADHFSAWRVSRKIDANKGIIMPGLINTHTHAAMALFRGLADDLPLDAWLNDHIFPAETKLDHEKIYAGTLLACAEMIMSGTTCFCDMYLFEEAVADAASHAGMRAVVGEVLYDFPSPSYGPIEQGFAYTEYLMDKFRDDPLITVAVEPHSPYLCAPDLLCRAAAISKDHGAPLVIHVSETLSEVARIQAKYGRTPVGHLAHIGVLSPRLLACHCTVLSGEDIALLAKFDVKVSHNPESNMKLASGIAPIPELLQAGVCVGLGTDGCASNNDLDLFLEMDTAAKLHKVNTLDPTVTDALTILKMATRQGAGALGLEKITGSLELGKKADIIVINTRKPHLTPMYNPISHLVYAVQGSDVSDSIINGRVVLEKGELQSLDLAAVMDTASGIAGEIKNNQSRLKK